MVSSDKTPLPGPEDPRITNLLAAQLDALIAADDLDSGEFIPQFADYGLDTTDSMQAYDLLHLATNLRDTLIPVAPSDEFVNRLRSDLLGKKQLTLMLRWRKLPAHYRLAASLGGLTLGLGIVLITIRRVMDFMSILNRRHEPEQDPGMSLNTAS